MTRLVKKAAAAKNIPLLALALFAAVFMGSKVHASFKVVQTQHWILDECTDPTNPECYSLAGGDLSEDCVNQQNAVCGINAPQDESVEDETLPLIEGQLETDLASGNFIGKPNIFRMPYIPSAK